MNRTQHRSPSMRLDSPGTAGIGTCRPRTGRTHWPPQIAGRSRQGRRCSPSGPSGAGMCQGCRACSFADQDHYRRVGLKCRYRRTPAAGASCAVGWASPETDRSPSWICQSRRRCTRSSRRDRRSSQPRRRRSWSPRRGSGTCQRSRVRTRWCPNPSGSSQGCMQCTGWTRQCWQNCRRCKRDTRSDRPGIGIFQRCTRRTQLWRSPWRECLAHRRDMSTHPGRCCKIQRCMPCIQGRCNCPCNRLHMEHTGSCPHWPGAGLDTVCSLWVPGQHAETRDFASLY